MLLIVDEKNYHSHCCFLKIDTPDITIALMSDLRYDQFSVKIPNKLRD
jgi:hypothetical protein